MERYIWIGPLRHIGGYGEVARNFVRGLGEASADVTCVDSHGLVGAAGSFSLEHVAPRLSGAVRSGGATCVYHADPSDLPRVLALHPMADSQKKVACTIAETNELPRSWVENLSPFDEVWVPSLFQRETFAFSGVPRRKLRVIPYGIDTEFYAPRGHRAAGRFRFTYVFAMGWRKGFDVLLEAFLSEFRRSDDVELFLKVLSSETDQEIRSELIRSVADKIDFFDPNLPRVVVDPKPVNRSEMRELLRSTDLYVSTDRANGWGMPCQEAMAAGVATATVDWSGSTEFMHEENCLLIQPGPLEPVDGRLVATASGYEGQKWPSLDVADVRDILRRALAFPEDLVRRAATALDEIRNHRNLAAAARGVLDRDTRPYQPRAGLLDKVLRGLERPGPSALLEGSRKEILLCRFDLGDTSFLAPLRAYLQGRDPGDDVTLCLWANTEGPDGLEALAQMVTEEVERFGGFDGTPDVNLILAPEDHIPWDRVRLDHPFRPESRHGAQATPVAERPAKSLSRMT